MPKIIYLTCCLLFIATLTQADSEKNILTLQPGSPVKNAPFVSVSIYDIRYDTMDMGFIKTGIFNRMRRLHFRQNFSAELQQFHQSTLAAPARANKLLVAVRRFYVSEHTGFSSEKGYFAWSAVYFMSMTEDSLRYQKIMEVDTVFVCKAGDVTKKLTTSVGPHLAGLLAVAAQKAFQAPSPRQTWLQEEAADYINTEKQRLPLYNISLPTRGIYATFDELKNNTPSDTVLEVDSTTKRYKMFFHPAANGKKAKEIEPGTVYAICDGARLYKSTDHGFYRMKKEKSDFFFTGRTSTFTESSLGSGSSPGSVIAGALVGGVAGAFLAGYASSQSAILCKFMIDPVSGNLIFIQEVKERY